MLLHIFVAILVVMQPVTNAHIFDFLQALKNMHKGP